MNVSVRGGRVLAGPVSDAQDRFVCEVCGQKPGQAAGEHAGPEPHPPTGSGAELAGAAREPSGGAAVGC